MSSRLVGVGLASMLLVAACGGADDDPEAGGEATTATGTEAPADTGQPSDEPDGSDGEEASDAGTPASGEADTEAVFRWGYSSVAASLDPTETTSSFQYLYLQPIYDSLVTRTLDGEFEPGIAESWELSDDGLTFTMQLAEGRTFHDGTPIDGEAVRANLQRVLDSGSTIAAEIEIIDEIVVDASEITLELNSPGGRLPAVLSDQAGMMMSPAGFDASDRSIKPVGSGPFTVAENSESLVSYDKWDGYHDADAIQLAGFDIVVQADDNTRLAAVQTGEIDATFIRTSQMAEAEAAGLQLTAAPRTFYYGMGLNASNEALANDKVRQAISHAIDRESINQGLYDGDCVPSVQPYPNVFWGYWPDGSVEDYGNYDPDRARELLAEAGYEDGLDLTIGSLTITTYSSLLEVLQAQLGDVGINVEPVLQDSAQYTTSVRQGAFDGWIGPTETGRPDVTTFWKQNYLPGGATNPGDYELPGLPGLIEQADLTTDQAERSNIVQQIVEASLDNGPRAVAICVPNLIFAAGEHVSNLQVPLDGNYTFRHVFETAD